MSVVLIPKQNDVDDDVLVYDFKIEEGRFVEKGMVLLTMESSKGTEELVATESGYVRAFCVKEGESISVGERICELTPEIDSPLSSSNEQMPSLKEKVSERVHEEANRGPGSTPFDVTPKARRVMEALEVGPNELTHPVNRTKDLVSLLMGKDEVTSFLNSIQNDKAFAQLESSLKIQIYRQFGFLIEENVCLGEGVLLLSPKITLKRGVRIQKGSLIRCDEFLEIGENTVIHEDVDLQCNRLIIGGQVRVMSKVRMDMAGGGVSESEVNIADRCHLGEESYINGCRAVLMEEHSCLSPRAMIFTHGFWQDVFEGYDSRFGPVTLKKDSWVGASAQVLPGVVVGEGAIVVSGSLVSKSVDKETMVAGIPAKVVKEKIKRNLSIEEKESLLEKHMPKLLALLEHKGCELEEMKETPHHAVSIRTISGKHHTLFWPKALQTNENSIVIGFSLPQSKGTVFDLQEKVIKGEECVVTDEIRNFFRRLGVNFSPHDWSYDFKHTL